MNRRPSFWKASKYAVGEFLFPSECLLCAKLLERKPVAGGLRRNGSPGNSVHPYCDHDLPSIDASFCELCMKDLVSDYSRCPRCALPVPDVAVGKDCMQCRKAKWRFDRVVTLGPYRGLLQQAVIRMKKPHEHLLRRSMAELISHRLVESELNLGSEQSVDGDHPSEMQTENAKRVVVSVPNHWTHSVLGAADSAGELAKSISARMDWPLASGLMRRIRKTRKQGMLSRGERIENVKDAFAIRDLRAIEKKTVYLVDDVLTTGATCGELARLLKRNGANSVIIVVPARGTGGTLPIESQPIESQDRKNGQLAAAETEAEETEDQVSNEPLSL